ncbi:putative metalloprotease CJM1_0395 family protein [Trichloromonas sp.]|uniref:putative metalloprotease CJM1_0395 family protein n=1 Tax=Trichloromonas sp. TaxID=3069249 RepID=UPI002A4A3A2E|nr:putative metalloprotease CJM1_0395 family protein [Trichloromonas sp.]
MAEISEATTYSINPLAGYPRNSATEEPQDSYAASRREDGSESSENSPSSAKDKVTISREAQQILQLARIDRQVRAHEAAHSAAGGQYAGAPSYSYKQGPDGKRYAVAGEVPIDVSPVSGDPEASIQKARVVRAAALAPADPSPQDRQVAAAATRMEMKAQSELQALRREEVSQKPKSIRSRE